MCVWNPKMLQEPNDHFFLEINQNLSGMNRTATMVGNSILNKSTDLPGLMST